jgi:Putative zinc-finger
MHASDGCGAARIELGAYLLGTIGPADRDRVDAHLASCGRCREELASLAGLPALLRRVTDSEARLGTEQPTEKLPDAMLTSLVRRAARVRRRHRAVAAATAVALAAGTAAAAVAAVQPARPVPGDTGLAQATTVRSASRVTGAQAAIRYAPRPWGTELEARITGVHRGTRCQLWVTSTNGRRIEAGGWIIAAGQGLFWYPASVPLTATSLRSFQITSAGTTLVTIAVGRAAG